MLAATPASAGWNAAFRWCQRCQGMWQVNAGNNGHCPVDHWWDHSHYQSGSGIYWFVDTYGEIIDGTFYRYGQAWLKWCLTCKGAFVNAGRGICPNNGDSHTPSVETYLLEATYTSVNWRYAHQTGWRLCNKCHGLFFIDNGVDRTHCPAGNHHEELWSNGQPIQCLPRYGPPPGR